MKIDLSRKTVLVTGGSGAIGSALCKKFAGAGANIIIADIDEHKSIELEQELVKEGARAKFIFGNIANQDSMQELCQKAIQNFGKIDVLINNAGVNVSSDGRKPIQEFNDQDWHKIIDIDLTGVYFCSKPIIKHMVENDFGKIINISSVAGLVPLRLQCAFAAAKAGVVNLTKAMAIELAPHNIAVNCICPGSILHEGTQAVFYGDKAVAERFLSHIPMNRPGKPEDVSGAAVFLASDEASYMTGSVLTIDGGWTCGYARDF